MIELLYSWVKNLAIYLILVTAVLNVIPNNSYKRYVKFFTGMIMIIILISPVAKLLNFEDMLNFNFDTQSYKQEVESMKNRSKYMESVQSDYLIAAYESEVQGKVEELVKQDGLYPVSVDVSIENNAGKEDFGTVKEITVTAAAEEQRSSGISVDKVKIGKEAKSTGSYEEVSLKNKIEDFYNVSSDNINISIQR